VARFAGVDPKIPIGRYTAEYVIVHVGEPFPLIEDLSGLTRERISNDVVLTSQQTFRQA
jgi:hypothetical protein